MKMNLLLFIIPFLAGILSHALWSKIFDVANLKIFHLQQLLDSSAEVIKEYSLKLEFLAKFVEIEDGIFTFPDGDYVETKRKK